MTIAKFIKVVVAEGRVPNAFEYEDYRKNLRDVDEVDACCLCGKKALRATYFGYLNELNRFVAKETDPDRWGLGFYPLGTDCAARLKKINVPVYAAEPGHFPDL